MNTAQLVMLGRKSVPQLERGSIHRKAYLEYEHQHPQATAQVKYDLLIAGMKPHLNNRYHLVVGKTELEKQTSQED